MFVLSCLKKPLMLSTNRELRFDRSARLLKPSEFSAVFSLKRYRSNTYFQVLGLPNGASHGRLGVVVSKKVDKRAVGRNRIKRLVRETFRLNAQSLGGCDYVVRARRALSRSDCAEARRALLSLFPKLRQACLAQSP